MKNIILATVSTMIGVLTMMIVMTVYGRINRSMELQSNLSSVLEGTMENVILNEKYGIENTNEVIADLTEALVVSLDSQSDVNIHILECDNEKGILSVNIELEYIHPNGEKGMVSCDKTVIANKLSKEEEADICKVSFYLGDELYKEYIVKQGSSISVPAEPLVEERTFYGWIDENGDSFDFIQSITSDTTIHADIR